MSTDILTAAGSILGLLVSLIFGVMQLRRSFPNRNILKTELEILTLLDSSSHPQAYREIEKSVNTRLENIYTRELSVADRLTIILTVVSSLAVCLFFGVWTYNLSGGGFNWWSLATGYISLFSLFVLILALIRNRYRLFDSLGGPQLFVFWWRLLTSSTSLTLDEKEAANKVLGDSTVRYQKVRIAEGGLLNILMKINGSRAFTLYNVINLPTHGHNTRASVDLLVHELVHVYQFQRTGTFILAKALRAQKSREGPGGWEQLKQDWETGKRFRHYDVEEQGRIAQGYYTTVIQEELAVTDPIRLAYEPFINELKAGDI